MYIWFPYKTPYLSEPQYNTPLPKVHKGSLGNDLGRFSFLLGLLYGFRIRTQTMLILQYKTPVLHEPLITILCFLSSVFCPLCPCALKDYRRVADTVGACGAHTAEHYFVTVGVCK